jgi:hypothetical protein
VQLLPRAEGGRPQVVEHPLGGGRERAAGVDMTVHLWITDPNRAIDDICTNLARDLHPEEWAQFLPEIPHHETCT